MEEYKIEFLRTALKELAKLPVEIQQRIAVRIEELKFLSPKPDTFAASVRHTRESRIKASSIYQCKKP